MSKEINKLKEEIESSVISLRVEESNLEKLLQDVKLKKELITKIELDKRKKDKLLIVMLSEVLLRSYNVGDILAYDGIYCNIDGINSRGGDIVIMTKMEITKINKKTFNFRVIEISVDGKKVNVEKLWFHKMSSEDFYYNNIYNIVDDVDDVDRRISDQLRKENRDWLLEDLLN